MSDLYGEMLGEGKIKPIKKSKKKASKKSKKTKTKKTSKTNGEMEATTESMNSGGLEDTVNSMLDFICRDESFECNDELVRSGILNDFSLKMGELKTVGMVDDFEVICDDTNNTQHIIDERMLAVGVNFSKNGNGHKLCRTVMLKPESEDEQTVKTPNGVLRELYSGEIKEADKTLLGFISARNRKVKVALQHLAILDLLDSREKVAEAINPLKDMDHGSYYFVNYKASRKDNEALFYVKNLSNTEFEVIDADEKICGKD